MKRFILFAHAVYYPQGGWNDHQGYFDSVEDALSYWTKNYNDECWNLYHIVDTVTGEVVDEAEDAVWRD